MQAAVDEVEVPAGAPVSIGGVAAQQQDAFTDLGPALLVATALADPGSLCPARQFYLPFSARTAGFGGGGAGWWGGVRGGGWGAG